MSNKYHINGSNFSHAYQASGIPFVSSSSPTDVSAADTNSASKITHIKIPFVTKWFTIKNIGKNSLRIAFSEAGTLKKNEYLTDGTAKTSEHLNFFIIPCSGTNGHPLANDASMSPTEMTFNLRCTDLFMVSDEARTNPGTNHATGFSLIAGLTTIPRSNFPILTGSLTGSATTKHPDGIIPGFEGIG